MKKIIKHYPMTGRLIVTRGYFVFWRRFSDERCSIQAFQTIL